jgi:hypothetical protein
MAVLCTRLASLLAHFSLSSSAPRSFAARFGKAKRAIAALAIPELAFNQLKKDFSEFPVGKKRAYFHALVSESPSGDFIAHEAN